VAADAICYGRPVSYRFGDFVVDTASYSLMRAGQIVPVRPKVFDLLRYLIERRERVVPKQELLEALWSGQHVDDFAVPWTVSHTRRALGQDTGAQQPIQTVRGRGYRFVAEVMEFTGEPTPAAPPALQSTEPDPFVGREPLMEQLQSRLSRAKQGHGGFCLLVGEAGIGKTRCLDELAARGEALDFAVCSSRSIEASCGPVFWPWIQNLQALVRELPVLAEAGDPLIARLMTYPELPDSAGRAPAPAPALPMGSDRFWQYEAVASLLHAAARQRPLLLAFDDLHCADRGTWELLEFLAPGLRRSPILIAGARREDGGGALSRAPRHLQARDAARFKLDSLSTADVARYLQLLTGSPPDRLLCEALREASAGNPWFLRETVDTLRARHGADALATLDPGVVRPAGAAVDRLRGRIAALAPDARAVLQMASVLGERFELELLARVDERPVELVLAALEEPRAEGLIAIAPGQRARFCHGLLRTVVYEDLALAERLRCHLRAARALERALDPLHYGDLAHHYQRALPLADPAAAAAAAVRAASAAARVHAYADAAQFMEWATQAQLNDPQAGPRARAECLLQRALYERLAGREVPARASVTSMFELARAHGFHALMLQGARVLRISFALGCIPDPLALDVLEEVLASCPAGASEERVGALSLLSWIPPHALHMERSKRLSAEALTLARELGSSSGLCAALHARLYALSGPDDIDALLATADELLAVSGKQPWFGLETRVASYRAHLYRSDFVAADACLSTFTREAQEQGLAEVVWYADFFRAQRVFSLGEFARVERLFAELGERGGRLRLTQAPLLIGVASALLTHERQGAQALAQTGNVDGLLAALFALPTVYVAFGARLAAELGRLDLARQTLYQLSQREFEPIVKDLGYVNALANLGICSILLDDRPLASALYERLSPYARHNTPSGAVGFYEGAAARFVARLAAYLGDSERAERYFEEGVALNEQMGALPQVARTCLEYASWLTGQGRKVAALAFTQRAREIAEPLGMQELAARAALLA
jgi:DNA-binding winged helix-turn-helix (wHTH) protein/tetratricopeptide (TPR) repeat protein